MATGTKLMKEISDQFLICKICLEPFKEPKTLSCLHTFCCACVQQQYDAEANRPTRYTLYARAVTCPVCRKKTELPTGGVRRLPDNFLVSNLTDVLAKRRCVSKVPPCEICQTVRSRSSDACSKCLDCDKLLCRACVELHSSTKVTQDHSLIDLEGQKDIECKAHPEETVRFYCEKCEECICVVCTFQEHKDHDVCSFNDGFAKHKVSLEGLLGRSKERLTGVSRRLKVIEKYETLSKELKERIRDLAISYTSKVRAREKELIKKVDELFSGEVTQLAEKKTWLQESFDSLQSACNLTEIVMKDKGVEMLLLKKEIQGKMDHLLGAPLPPEPPDLRQLDVTFVPGEVKLGEFFVPGKAGEQQIVRGRMDKPAETSDSGNHNTREDTANANPRPCIACFKRKRQEERQKRDEDEDPTKEKKRKATKSVYIQTRSQEKMAESDHYNSHFTTTASQVNAGCSTGVSVSHSSISMQTHTAIVSSRCAGTDNVNNTITDGHNNTAIDEVPSPPQVAQRARGTMTARQDVRTLKIQTDESCLRDLSLAQAVSTGSSYPNTGAAIAAACLTQTASEENALAKSWPVRTKETENDLFSSKQTQDAEVATDITLSLTGSLSDALTALCQGETGTGIGVNGTDHRKPDLLAETGLVAVPTPPSSPWIRTRKIQTEISALTAKSAGEERVISDEELKKSLLISSDSSSIKENRDTLYSLAASPLLCRSKDSPSLGVSCCDVGVMTPFKVKLVQDCVDRDTSTEAVTSNCIGVMTSLDTRTVYIQTLRKRMASTATGTDYEGQMSKSTSTQLVTSIDAETAMPQVLHESRNTWTDALITSERATCTEGPETSDAVTLTTQVVTNDFTAQMRPETVVTSTNTTSPKMMHHQIQTAPTLLSTGTDPDLSHLEPSQNMESSPADSKGVHPLAGLRGLEQREVLPGQSLCAGCGDVGVKEVERADVAVETESPQFVTIATGPNSQMLSCRTASTDTLHLLQVSDRETCTPTVKTVDEWTYTAQPQMINTGVTPLRPAVLEVGVATTPITLMDNATYTEVKIFRDSGTENCLVVCDNETLTEKTTLCDAQTGVDINMESQGTSMELVECTDGSCMTEKFEALIPAKETQDTESQCQPPMMTNKEVNTTRFRRKAREAQTSFSYVECMLCEHPEKLEQMAVTKTFTDTSTDPSPPDTHDVATMALSCLASSPGLVDTGVQTSAAQLYDKEVATSFDFDEDFPPRPFLGLECQDAATSTESLPYIGLLSEIDVDELIVIPEANFELVSDSDEDCVSMVDDETLTEVLDYVEVGTQTLSPTAGSGATVEESPVLVRPEDECCKHLVSIGVNTMPKVTFEKETSTPIRHLFSKGTMTFFVAKMDKATSTISQIRSADARHGAAAGGAGGGRVVKEASRPKATDNKVTMTNRAEQRDMAVETDSSLVDGRITQCISKLRNVSERLNSPTLRKTLEGDVFFGQSFVAHRQKDSNLLASPSSPKIASSPAMSPRDANVFLLSPPKDGNSAEEAQRQTQLHNLLAETDAVLKSKDLSPVRKAQPITTLKPRSPVTPGDVSHYASKSLPRPRSLDRQNKVKMGSKATSPSRLPLLRYNSAPERIATLPSQTLLMKTGQTSPRTSPSRIPISQKQTAATGIPSSAAASDSGPDSDTYSTSSSQKVQQRPSLPSISETRTPSSCSDSSFVSIESGGSSLNPPSVMTTSHSRTPSNVTSVSDTTSEVTQTKGSAETLSTDVRESTGDDSSSVSSTSTAFMVTPPNQRSKPSPGSAGKQKKEKKGFMKRFLGGGKKKKDSSSSECEKEGTAKADGSITAKQHPEPTPKSPQEPHKPTVQPKTQQGARPKNVPRSEANRTSASSAAAATASKHPPPPVSTPACSRPSSTDSAHASTKGGASAAAAAAPASAAAAPPMPPHHYPPLPDPNKTPPPPRKPRPFVYVRQRIFSIQQDNVEEVKERKEKEKEEKEKGKTKGKEQVKVTANEHVKVTGSVKVKAKEEKTTKERPRPLCSVKAAIKSEREVKGKEIKTSDKGTKVVKKAEKVTVSKPEKSEVKDRKEAGKPRAWVCGK